MSKITEHSFSYFLLPFLFEESSYAERVAAVSAAKLPVGKKENEQLVWREWQKLPVDAILSHVRRYLAPVSKDPVFQVWRLNPDCHSHYGIGQGAQWLLETEKKGREIPFKFGEAGDFAFLLVLSRSGVGVLVVDARPVSDSSEEWLDFLYAFRFIGGQRKIQLRCQRSVSDASTHTNTYEPYFPRAVTGAGVTAESGKGKLCDVLKLLLETARLKDNIDDKETWWREAFVDNQLLPYSGTLEVQSSADRWDDLLYRLRNTFPGSRTIAPGQLELRATEPRLLPYAERMSFFFSMDAIGFAALNPPDFDGESFFRETLPAHLRRDYFFVVLMCLLQRFTLLHLSELVADDRRAGTSKEVADAFERVRRLLHDFAGSLYFAQVMHSEHHHRVYRACQQAWLIGEMYREVRDEIREIHDFHALRQSNSLQKKVNWAVVFLAVPGLFLSFLGVNWKGFTSGEGLSLQTHWVPLIGAALFFAAVGLILHAVLGNQD